jgi:hypothetical protein
VPHHDLPVAGTFTEIFRTRTGRPRGVRREAQDVLRTEVGHDLVEDSRQLRLAGQLEEAPAGDLGQPAQLLQRRARVGPIASGAAG